MSGNFRKMYKVGIQQMY